MCKFCDDIDKVVKIACEDAKSCDDVSNPFSKLLFPYAVQKLSVFSCYANSEYDEGDLCLLLADGRVLVFENDNSFATYYNHQMSERIFKYCPHCGRKLD